MGKWQLKKNYTHHPCYHLLISVTICYHLLPRLSHVISTCSRPGCACATVWQPTRAAWHTSPRPWRSSSGATAPSTRFRWQHRRRSVRIPVPSIPRAWRPWEWYQRSERFWMVKWREMVIVCDSSKNQVACLLAHTWWFYWFLPQIDEEKGEKGAISWRWWVTMLAVAPDILILDFVEVVPWHVGAISTLACWCCRCQRTKYLLIFTGGVWLPWVRVPVPFGPVSARTRHFP